jgi:hypothetical protein
MEGTSRSREETTLAGLNIRSLEVLFKQAHEERRREGRNEKKRNTKQLLADAAIVLCETKK